VLCAEHEHALNVLSKLSDMLLEAVGRPCEQENAREYLSNIAEAKAIRQHMIALREELARHMAEHGC
jgi:hypothetical protein